MSSPRKDAQNANSVAEKVLRRVEINKMARKLQNRLKLAHFKTKHSLEHLSLDEIERKFEAEKKNLQKRRGSTGNKLSDSSLKSEFHYPAPLGKIPVQGAFFSDAVGSGSSSTGPRPEGEFEFESSRIPEAMCFVGYGIHLGRGSVEKIGAIPAQGAFYADAVGSGSSSTGPRPEGEFESESAGMPEAMCFVGYGIHLGRGGVEKI